MGWNGRIGELLRVAFGSYLAHTPYYAFINASIAAIFVYLFFVLIFARLPLTQNKGESPDKFSDISVICFVLICLFAFRGFGSVFYWAAGSFNYLWAWAIILAWCVPYRFFYNAVFDKANSAHPHDTNSQNTNSHTFSMLILGLFAGWASELGIVLVLFQIAFIAFACYKRIKLPLWYYAGVLGFIAGWCILYFSPGHAARASLHFFTANKDYVSIRELIAMPFAESFKRFASIFKDTMPHLIVAIFGIFVFLWLKFGSFARQNKVIIALCAIILIALYSIPNLRFVFVLLSVLLCFVAGFLLKKDASSHTQMKYLFVLSGLFLAYFLAIAATIQIGIPSRAKLPYTLLATAQIIIVWLLLKPYVANFAKIIGVSVCAACVLYALFVLNASIDMRLKWERMLASIDAQKAMGSEYIVVSADTFRSYYKGYGEWSSPNANTNDIFNKIYAKFFGVKKFIVKEGAKNVKFN